MIGNLAKYVCAIWPDGRHRRFAQVPDSVFQAEFCGDFLWRAKLKPESFQVSHNNDSLAVLWNIVVSCVQQEFFYAVAHLVKFLQDVAERGAVSAE